jgi:hypothetical protein
MFVCFAFVSPLINLNSSKQLVLLYLDKLGVLSYFDGSARMVRSAFPSDVHGGDGDAVAEVKKLIFIVSHKKAK